MMRANSYAKHSDLQLKIKMDLESIIETLQW